MNKRISFSRLVSCASLSLSIVCTPFIHVFASTISDPASANIILGEINWAGSSLSTSDEWIELWNLSDAPVSIGNWSLKSAGESNKTIFLPSDATIPAHGVFLISNYPVTDSKTASLITPDVVTSTVSLSNSNFEIELDDANGLMIDHAGDTKAPLMGASLPVKQSMLRLIPIQDGAQKTAWANATIAQNLKSNLTDLATPGFCDGCQTTPPPTPAPILTPTVTSTSPELTVSSVSSTTPLETSTATTTTVTTSSTDTTISSPAPSPTIPAQTTTTETNTPSLLATNSPPPYAMLRLNEFLPDPTQGKEWIEIVTLDASNPIPLAGCELRDSIGRIFTFTEGLLSPTSTHFIIELPSAKLNNGGDTLSLYSPSGQPLDSFTYTDSNKGQSWIRFPDGNGNWQQTLTPTPANTNILVSLPSTTSSTTNPTTSATIPITEANGTTAYAVTTAKIGTDNLSAADQLAGETVPIEPSLDSQLGSSLLDEETLTDLLGFEALIPIADKKPTLAKKTTTNSTTKTKTTASKKPNTKKSTPKSKATPKPAPLTITSFPMLNDLPSNMRVRVSGRVATRSGFLPNHAIVLLSPDGHGLLTTLPRSRKLPLPGTQLMVSGSISFSDRNTITLHVGTKDDYLERAASEIEALPRLVDILTPSAEDAWSLIHVTGTVITAKTNAITLDLQDSEVTIAIRPGVNYRAARVKPGDTITVSGVLDMDHETLRILPRTSEDIQLIQHAPTKTSATATPEPINLPPWTPFGAAAGAIAASEGVKRARQKFIQKKLERKLLALTKTHPTITA